MTSYRIGTGFLIGASLLSFSAAAIAQDNMAAGATNTTGTDMTATTAVTSDVNGVATDPLAANNVDPMMVEDPINTTEPYAEVEREDDNDFPWGLLGLLGLAGLLGRKKHDRDIHVDNRTDTRT